jgi:hypothetical protein
MRTGPGDSSRAFSRPDTEPRPGSCRPSLTACQARSDLNECKRGSKRSHLAGPRRGRETRGRGGREIEMSKREIQVSDEARDQIEALRTINR